MRFRRPRCCSQIDPAHRFEQSISVGHHSIPQMSIDRLTAGWAAVGVLSSFEGRLLLRIFGDDRIFGQANRINVSSIRHCVHSVGRFEKVPQSMRPMHSHSASIAPSASSTARPTHTTPRRRTEHSTYHLPSTRQTIGAMVPASIYIMAVALLALVVTAMVRAVTHFPGPLGVCRSRWPLPTSKPNTCTGRPPHPHVPAAGG